jgi:hypothetical protein
MLAVKLYDEGLPGRLAAHAYDFLIMMLGCWVLFPEAKWLSFAFFVLACIGGLFVFNNRLLSRKFEIRRPLNAVVTLVGLSAIILFPLIYVAYERQDLRPVAALAILIATRLLYVRVPVPKRPRLGPSSVMQRD